MKKPHEIFYSVTTGPERRRQILTPIGGLIFIALLLVVVFGGVFTDRALSLPRLLPGPPGSVLGALIMTPGLLLWGWCVLLFSRAKGTAVPFNPPRALVVTGPYARTRNPMLTGVCLFLFGLGFLLHSTAMVSIWTPLFVLLNVFSLKVLEEPELELRLGSAYTAYKRQVPMFFPRLTRHRGAGVA